jgi:AraC family transcriptional regulator of adaptative response/methylated-DNA-[protein]-cysteine methyltransferase
MNEEQYWEAVVRRDRQARGRFVYAVKSTGIYCVPGCPSRQPRRQQVAFFADPWQAEQQGFRPCQRCRPGQVHSHIQLVQQVCQYIEAHIEEEHTLTSLAEQTAISSFHLQKVFTQVMGASPRAYIEQQRLAKLKAELRNGRDVTSSIYAAGYNSSSQVYEHAADQLGMTPGTYRRGGRNVQIQYTISDSPLGMLLVAATPQGICSITLGDSEAELLAGLQKEFPAATIESESERLTSWVEVILQHLQGNEQTLTLPLDLQASAFQLQVWQALRQIPYGETRSYQDIARQLGDAKKARAVARACASNRVALVIPCHRVVRGNGEPGGYRWGVERKKQLLHQEQQRAK